MIEVTVIMLITVTLLVDNMLIDPVSILGFSFLFSQLLYYICFCHPLLLKISFFQSSVILCQCLKLAYFISSINFRSKLTHFIFFYPSVYLYIHINIISFLLSPCISFFLDFSLSLYFHIDFFKYCIQYRIISPSQVLIRLRVEHIGFPVINQQRFGSLFVGKIKYIFL